MYIRQYMSLGKVLKKYPVTFLAWVCMFESCAYSCASSMKGKNGDMFSSNFILVSLGVCRTEKI